MTTTDENISQIKPTHSFVKILFKPLVHASLFQKFNSNNFKCIHQRKTIPHLYILYMAMPPKIPLSTPTLLCTWYEESTPRESLTHINAHKVMSTSMQSMWNHPQKLLNGQFTRTLEDGMFPWSDFMVQLSWSNFLKNQFTKPLGPSLGVY